MSTLGTMITRIANETRRSESAEGTNIQNCILECIADYEQERFWWNWSRSNTFSLSSSQEYYTSVDAAFIAQVLRFDGVNLEVSSTDVRKMFPQSWETIEEWNRDANSRGDPDTFAYRGQSIRVYPIPTQGRTVRVAGLFKLASLSASTDTNAWVTVGQGWDLIYNAAGEKFCKKFLSDPDSGKLALAYESAKERAYDRLNASLSRREGTGRIKGSL